MADSAFSTSADDNREALERLRARASHRRQLVTQTIEEKSPEEVQRLVQELQVHQIELEMQYEELLLTQTELETTRARYLDLYDFAPVGYVTLNAQGVIQQLNLHASQLLGTVRQRLVGRRLPLFITAADRPHFYEFLIRVLATTHQLGLEIEIQREDGTTLFAQLNAVAQTEPDGTKQCRLAITDTTERQRATQALAASEAKFRQLFEESHDAVVLLQNNRIVDCNEAAVQLLGSQAKARIIGQLAWGLAPKNQPDGQLTANRFHYCLHEAIVNGSDRCELIMQRFGGALIWVEAVLTPIGEGGAAPLIHAVWRDITEQKQAVLRRQESDERLQLALAASRSGLWTLELQTDELYWDSFAQATYGRQSEPGPISFEVVRRAIHPDDEPRLQQAFRQAFEARSGYEVDFRVYWPDGSLHYVAAIGQVFYDEQDQPWRMTGLFRDVTERHLADEELKYKNRLLERILDNLPVMLARVTAGGELLELTGAGLRRLGLTSDMGLGEMVYQWFPTLEEPVHTLLTGQPVNFICQHTVAGEDIYFQKYGFFDEQKQWGIIFAIDITETQRAKATLQAEKDFSRNLLDNSIDGVVALDYDGRITAWNRVAEERTGLTEADMMGKMLYKVSPLFGGLDASELQRRVRRNEKFMLANLSSPLLARQFDAYVRPLQDASGTTIGTLIVVRDVTERNQMIDERTALKLRQQQEVLSVILTTQEAERKRIAEALHNGVGQLLYATKLTLENETATQTKSLQLLDEAIRATRTISFELTPGILEDFGLEVALKELCKRIPKTSLDVHMQLSGLEATRSMLVNIAIYRIVQELLNNVIKHARASEVFVYVVQEDGRLHISVEDDGVGFEVEKTAQAVKGIGLTGIRSRVDLLGGTFTIASRPDQGTIVTIVVETK